MQKGVTSGRGPSDRRVGAGRSGHSSVPPGKKSHAFTGTSELEFPNDEMVEDLHRQFDNVKTTLELAKQFRYEKNSWNTISEETFRQQVGKLYRTHERVIKALVQRFKQHRVQELAHYGKSEKNDIEFLEVLIAMVLLARVKYEKKLRYIFMICDDDGDGCMTPTGIRLMLHYILKAFPSETTQLEYSSTQLQSNLCSLKEEQTFVWIATQLNQKSEIDDQSLISYKEYKDALKTNTKLYSELLPRNLTLKQVLLACKKEQDFAITDLNVEDFLMFRYEMNIINKRLFLEEKSLSAEIALKLGKTQPIPSSALSPGRDLNREALISSKASGFPIYGLSEEEKSRVYEEYFRPPGRVKEKHVAAPELRNPIQLKPEIISSLPTGRIHQRVASQPPSLTMPATSLYATHTSPVHGTVRDDLTEASGAPSSLPPLNAVATRPTDIKHFNFGVFSEGEKPADYNKFLADYKRERERMQKKGIDIMAIKGKIVGELKTALDSMPKNIQLKNSKRLDAYYQEQQEERKEKMKAYEKLQQQDLLSTLPLPSIS